VNTAENNSVKFPIGTIVYYGPDDQTVTKIVAGVLVAKDAEILFRKWYGEGIVQDPAVIAEVGQFFQGHQVTKVIMTGSVAGCAHEEGIDYPIGDECPCCPYWLAKNQLQEID
jgi:hypothetical protein